MTHTFTDHSMEYDVEALSTIIGTPAGASIAADIAAIKAVADTIATDTTTDLPTVLGAGTDAAVAAGVAGSIHGHIRQSLVDTAALLADTGDGADAATADGAAGSLHSKHRTTYAMLGIGTDAAVAAGVAGSVQGHIRQALVDTAALLADTGDGADAATADGAAGSLHSKARMIYAQIGAPVGASISADIAAIKAVDDAIKVVTDKLEDDLYSIKWWPQKAGAVLSGTTEQEVLAGNNTTITELVLKIYQLDLPAAAAILDARVNLLAVGNLEAAAGDGNLRWYVSPMSVTETVGQAPSGSAVAITDQGSVTQGAGDVQFDRAGTLTQAAITAISTGGMQLLLCGASGEAVKTLTADVDTGTWVEVLVKR